MILAREANAAEVRDPHAVALREADILCPGLDRRRAVCFLPRMPSPREGRPAPAATPTFDFEGAGDCAPADAPAVRFVHGPLALQAELERGFAARRQALRADPRLLGKTLLVVVPSHHLARQVQAHLAVEGALGIRVATAAQAARDVLARVGTRARDDAAWYEAVLRGVVQADARARDAFVSGEGSWSLLGATVGDLLDAGLDADCAEAAMEALEGRGDEREALLLEIALAVQERLDRCGGGRVHARYAQAAEALRSDVAHWGFDEALVCGFADATGRLGAFLEALQRHFPCSVLWDATQSGLAGRGERHGRALREALGLGLSAEAPAAATPRLVRCANRTTEARLVAAEIHELVAGGAQAETIAIVVRGHDVHAARLCQALRELGVPVASSAPRRDAATRPLRALADVHEHGPDASLKSFCAALGERRPETRLGLAVLGLRTLGELAAPAVLQSFDGDGLRLPVRIVSAAEEEPDDDEEETSHADEGTEEPRDEPAQPARTLPRSTIERLHAAARDFLEAWEAPAALESEPSRLLERWTASLLQNVAAAVPDAAARERVRARFAALVAGCPAVPLPPVELRRVLCRELRQAAEAAAPAGGGVVVATASQLRSCAFARLYLPLCEHGRWPRVPREDPLLSDAARRALQAVLPALSCTRDGREEEAGLRASLWRAAPLVVVSHARVDEEGKELRASAWFEDCAAAGAAVEERRDESCSPAPAGPRTPREHALAAALAARTRRPEELAALHALAVEDARARHGLPPVAAAAVAKARTAWLLECEAPRAARGTPSPLLGKDCSLPAGPLYATTIEGYVKCPWQTLLVRGLKLRAPLDPEADLPTVDARLLGIVLHAAAARLAPRQGGRLDALLAAEGRAPGDDVAEAVQAATRETLRAEGLAGRGLEPLVVDRVGRLLALALDFAKDPPWPKDGWIAAEVEGQWNTGLPRLGSLRFRADRLERRAGRPELVDLKTGKPLHGSASQDAGRIATGLQKQMRRARLLQGALYSLASGSPARYDHLVVDEEPTPNNRYHVDLQDQALQAACMAALEAIDAALGDGHWLPRLVDASGTKSGPACAHCEVSLACRQGDSAAARRVRELVEHERLRDGASSLLRLWDLPQAKVGP